MGLETELNPQTTTLTSAEIEELIAQRKAARLTKNYAEGDRLRLILQQAGITLIDLPNGEIMIK